MALVQVGDTLVAATGVARIVREVHRHEDGRLRSVAFDKLHPSWTRDPHTIVDASLLKQRGFQRPPAGAVVAP